MANKVINKEKAKDEKKKVEVPMSSYKPSIRIACWVLALLMILGLLTTAVAYLI